MYGGYGRQFLADYPSLGGKVFIVMSSTDARFNMVQDILKTDPDGVVRLYTDIEEAYDATTTNSNDVIYYFGGSSSQNLTETLTWSKNYVHLIGVCAPVGIGNRARIFMTSTVDDSPMVTVSGSGCVFKNFSIFHGIDDAAALIAMTVSGSRNYFENVRIAGIGDTTQDAAGACSLKLDGAEENTFVNCVIGLDTISAGTAANSEILVDGASKRNLFKDCKIVRLIEHETNHPLVKLADATAIDRDLTFDNCLFLNMSENYGTTQTGNFKLVADLTQGYIILKDCVSVGATQWDVDDRNKIYLFNSPTPAADTAGISRAV
jgi:hypothetical protein